MLEAEPFTMPARMQCYPRAAVVREKKHRIQKGIQGILTAGTASYAHGITQRLAGTVQRQAK
jgi:hypothetical protein